MVGRQHQQQGVLKERVDDELLPEVKGVSRLGENQSQVQFPGAERGKKRRELSLPQGYMDSPLVERADRRWQKQGTGRGKTAPSTKLRPPPRLDEDHRGTFLWPGPHTSRVLRTVGKLSLTKGDP